MNQDNAFASLFQAGLSLLGTGRRAAALHAFEQARDLRPDAAVVYNNIGLCLRGLNRPTDAIEAYRQAATLDPGMGLAYANLCEILISLGELDDAIAIGRIGVAVEPANPAVYAYLLRALTAAGCWEEATALAYEGIARHPDRAVLYCGLGLSLNGTSRRGGEEELAAYRQALALNPSLVMAHMGLGHSLLLRGDYRQGWPEFEWGLPRRELPQPEWQGEDLTGRTLLVFGDLGYGDSLQFARYIAPIAARAAKVLLAVPAPLTRLFASIPGRIEMVPPDGPYPAFDCHTGLMRAPRLFGHTLDTIPNAVPYLRPKPEDVAGWRDRLSNLHGLKVGLVWAGESRSLPGVHAATMNNARRSIALGSLAPLLAIDGVHFISLQKGQPSAQILELPQDNRPLNYMDEIDDFADTAALVANLDLVISVDTSAVHLAGAIGKPVWILSRFDGCWRWLLNRDDSPWYPTARLFRQERPGDWAPVVARLAEELAGKKAPSPHGGGDLNQSP